MSVNRRLVVISAVLVGVAWMSSQANAAIDSGFSTKYSFNYPATFVTCGSRRPF